MLLSCIHAALRAPRSIHTLACTATQNLRHGLIRRSRHVRSASCSNAAGVSSLHSQFVTCTVLSACANWAGTGLPLSAVEAFSSDIIRYIILLSREEPSSLRLTVRSVPSSQVELLSDILLGLGAESVTILEHKTGAGEAEADAGGRGAAGGRSVLKGIFSDGQEGGKVWPDCVLQAHFSIAHDMSETIEVAKRVLQRPGLEYEVEEVVPQEWVESIKASYVPLQVTPELWIIPDWSQPVDPGAINIILQPGVAFGTGEHPTTRLCLQHLLGMDLVGRSIVDYGTGSGVLAIAALLLGATRAVATDVDELSLKAARANAELNNVADQLQVLPCGPTIEDEEPLLQAGIASQFDICVSNILRGPLLDLQPRLSGYVREGGTIILSGVLEAQVPEILEAYKGEFCNFKVTTDADWALITATKREDVL